MNTRAPVFVEHVEFRPAEFQVLLHGERAGLTIREFELLFALAERNDRVVQRPELYDLVWGGRMAHRDRSVDVFVRKVRRKLELASPSWTYVHTHFGVGYRFSPEPVLAPGPVLPPGPLSSEQPTA
ncbi:MAG: winged helix-turn-helix transcriptional regulator [Solirubrobacterales bacterium]|nr:winged helix-turn-helix transcriptional regulator [Solirubrobacterales bacterium]